MNLDKAKCPGCEKVLAVQPPRGGDGSVAVFPRHYARTAPPPAGEPLYRCEWSRQEVTREHYVETS